MRRAMKWLRLTAMLLVLMLALTAAQATPVKKTVTADGTLTVWFLDVGQADAAVLSCNGAVMLIDGGNAGDSQLIYSFLKNTLGVSYLDAIIVTHAHEDHVGGVAAALNACTAGKLYCSQTEGDSRAFNSMLKYAALQELEITVPEAGDSFMLGTAQVTFLGPVDRTAEDINNLSLVVRVDFGDTGFLFTGDMEEEEEQSLLASGADLRADVLKVGHHGSSSSSTKRFLNAVCPRWAVISVGAGNSYGHPAEDTLTRLEKVHAQVFRTDTQGMITCVTDGASVEFITER